MEYTTLGDTGIAVSKVCLGCMSFGQAGLMHNWTLNESETAHMVKHAIDLGINFFDTANVYSGGTSESFLAAALKGVPRDKVVLASKVYFNPGRLSREAIFREIEGTLKRLGHVRVSVPEDAVRGAAKRVDAIFGDGKPLQLALPRRRA